LAFKVLSISYTLATVFTWIWSTGVNDCLTVIAVVPLSTSAAEARQWRFFTFSFFSFFGVFACLFVVLVSGQVLLTRSSVSAWITVAWVVSVYICKGKSIRIAAVPVIAAVRAFFRHNSIGAVGRILSFFI